MDRSRTSSSLLRHGRLIAVGTCVSMLAAFIVSRVSPKIYRATTYVLISESKVNPEMSHPEWDYSFLPTYIQFVDNESLAADAIKRFQLDKEPYKLTPHRLLQSVDVQVVKTTRLLQIDVDFRNPQLAADLANYLASGAARLNSQINDVDTVNTQNFLKQRLDQASARLDEARSKDLEVERRARIEDRENQLKILLDEKAQVAHQIEDQRAGLAQNRQRSVSLERSLKAEPSTLTLKKSVDTDRFLEHAVQSAAPGEHGDFSVTEETANPTRQELTRELAESTANMAANEAGLASAGSSLTRIDREAAALASDVAQLRAAVSEAAENVKVAQEGYESAARDYRNASVTVTARSQDLKPVSPAMVPENSIRPRVLVNTIAAGLLGFVLCAGLALAIDGVRSVGPERLRVVEREAASGG